MQFRLKSIFAVILGSALVLTIWIATASDPFTVRIDDIHIHDGESLELTYTIISPSKWSSEQICTGFDEFPLPTKNELSKLDGSVFTKKLKMETDANHFLRHSETLELIRENSSLQLNQEMPGRFRLSQETAAKNSR